MAVGGEVAVFQVVAGETLVASGVVVFEDGEGKAHLIRGQTGGGADGIVVSKFHVRQVDVPVVLSFVDDHRQHLSHGVVDPLGATVAVGVLGARRDVSHAEELVHGKRQLGAGLLSIIEEEAGRAPPKRYILVDQDLGGAVGREFCCRDGVHVCAASESIREE